MSSLKVDIEDVSVIRGITIPRQLIYRTLYKNETRVNLVHFMHLCEVCESKKAHYYCTTEKRWTCIVCNDFCHRKAHSWEDSSWDLIGEMKTKS